MAGKKKKDLMRRPVTYLLRFILLTAVASNPRQIDPGLPEVAAGRAQRSAPRCCLSNPSRGQKEHVAKLEINSELLNSFIHSVCLCANLAVTNQSEGMTNDSSIHTYSPFQSMGI